LAEKGRGRDGENRRKKMFGGSTGERMDKRTRSEEQIKSRTKKGGTSKNIKRNRKNQAAKTQEKVRINNSGKEKQRAEKRKRRFGGPW